MEVSKLIEKRHSKSVEAEDETVPLSCVFDDAMQNDPQDTFNTTEQRPKASINVPQDDRDETKLKQTCNVISNDEELTLCCFNGPEPSSLTNGKEYHLFVSHSSDDRDRVLSIVKELEDKYKLKCLLDERDFRRGKSIFGNIDDAFDTSEKIVFMLSKNFVKSNWCKHEVELAFVRRMYSQVINIIPVKLDDCVVPSPLATLTYIDMIDASGYLGRSQSDDNKFTADMIFTAFTRTESKDPASNGETRPEQRGIQVANVKKENGFSIPVTAERQPLCTNRPAKSGFHLTDVMLENIRQNNILITQEDLCRTFRLLNSQTIVKYATWNSWRNPWPALEAFFCMIPILILLAVVIWCLVVLCTGKPNQLFFYKNGFLAGFLLWLATLVMVGIATTVFICWRKRKFDKEVEVLKQRLWREVTAATLHRGIIVLYDSSYTWPTKIQIMRYDIESCKSYLVTYIKHKEEENVASNVERFVTTKLTELVERLYPDLVQNFSKLPAAPYTRHRVKKGRQCFCQMLEEELFKKTQFTIDDQ